MMLLIQLGPCPSMAPLPEVGNSHPALGPPPTGLFAAPHCDIIVPMQFSGAKEDPTAQHSIRRDTARYCLPKKHLSFLQSRR